MFICCHYHIKNMGFDKYPAEYKNCEFCPRSCGARRAAGEKGFCKESASLRIACAVLYKGEEPPLSGGRGSGAIFVSGCNLGCAFCQTHQASQGEGRAMPAGREVSTPELGRLCLALQNAGAQNINFVTPSHHAPAIAAGITAAKGAGLKIPVVWNTSAYEREKSLEVLGGLADIFLPDLKTLNPDLAAQFFNARDYPDVAKAAILKMIDLTGGDARRVIIRHLVLPGHLDASFEVLRWFARHAKGRASLSVMTQYTPVKTPARARLSKKVPDRPLSRAEYETVLRFLAELGIEDGFCQEFTQEVLWLPDFYRANPFPAGIARPLWHFMD